MEEIDNLDFLVFGEGEETIIDLTEKIIGKKNFEEIDGIVSENSEFRYQIDIFLREIALAARSLRSFADYLERNPDALIRGKQRREAQK